MMQLVFFNLFLATTNALCYETDLDYTINVHIFVNVCQVKGCTVVGFVVAPMKNS